MPQTIETIVYSFDELDEKAKDVARNWFREHALDYDWYTFVYEDFANICEILGVDLDTKGKPSQPAIYFSGFCSQGDGACFEGNYSYSKFAAKKIRDYAPKDVELHQIADMLQDIQRRNFYQLTASIKQTGRYYHEYSMTIDVERNGKNVTVDVENTIIEALRNLARWLYCQLERGYEYLMSNEQIDESLMANEYTFTKCGNIF